MAKTSWIERNEKRKTLTARHREQRTKLKAVIRSLTANEAEKDAAMRKLQALPRNSSPVRIKNRCQVSGRAHAFVRRFGLSRIAFREMALEGKIPGVRKASW
ncbi:MAG: 30S ribosomal protein S14 [Gemmatimonadetes bacterium]|jgi:small subunit ribosomal protein S14|nr:30S ribosomal protein S14 [Gemmatimonadota bacterium]MBP6444047.1 30S ribosomal protein S14 [Gemmatimonadales bacterium]MBK9548913.1 30S ribosomal protein S14 [Gemmatimonadota bacterium]MBL0178873.1 30S ribosomal protein S14 [Gemmatimonadota bacterium]MBP6570451.1 30S ribosomal protein S14 [Gemmatimonadales bacterium]